MSDGCYYFGCTVSFDCPICGRASAEKFVYEARHPEPKRVAQALSRERFDCQQCGAALVGRTKLTIHVLPADNEGLKRRGFVMPQAA